MPKEKQHKKGLMLQDLLTENDKLQSLIEHIYLTYKFISIGPTLTNI